ncbi:DUF1854 domain-containing protein, partial [bacterium]|nr:DUF1854 domain-containing protein [bacterium]
VLERDESGRLLFRSPAAPGAPVAGVRVARCFPWSHADGYISIRNKEGHELCLFRSLTEATPATRRQIEEELARQEFLPRITVVEQVDDRFDVMAWKVQTDRGPIELQVEHGEDIRRLEDDRVLIKDHSGGWFVVPDLAAMDARSRRLLEERLA